MLSVTTKHSITILKWLRFKDKMNKLLSISLISLLTILIFSCDKNNNCESSTSIQIENCIDSTLINDSIYCYEIYEPVCGCDKVTYENSCFANASGVTTYVSGECCD